MSAGPPAASSASRARATAVDLLVGERARGRRSRGAGRGSRAPRPPARPRSGRRRSRCARAERRPGPPPPRGRPRGPSGTTTARSPGHRDREEVLVGWRRRRPGRQQASRSRTSAATGGARSNARSTRGHPPAQARTAGRREPGRRSRRRRSWLRSAGCRRRRSGRPRGRSRCARRRAGAVRQPSGATSPPTPPPGSCAHRRDPPRGRRSGRPRRARRRRAWGLVTGHRAKQARQHRAAHDGHLAAHRVAGHDPAAGIAGGEAQGVGVGLRHEVIGDRLGQAQVGGEPLEAVHEGLRRAAGRAPRPAASRPGSRRGRGCGPPPR